MKATKYSLVQEISKLFISKDLDSTCSFMTKITNYDKKRKLHKIVYEEDHDEEDPSKGILKMAETGENTIAAASNSIKDTILTATDVQEFDKIEEKLTQHLRLSKKSRCKRSREREEQKCSKLQMQESHFRSWCPV